MTLAKTTIIGLAALVMGIGVPPVTGQNKEAAKSSKAQPKAAPAKAKAQPKTAATAKMVPAASTSKDESAANTTAQAPSGSRRDPFMPLINEQKGGGGPDHLPPGKAGLVITSVRVDGTVRSEVGMIAVLSNADQRTYFVREGDRLYDGAVEKIGLDGVTFRQNSKDAFGKMVERVVTKRIYASAGEQQ